MKSTAILILILFSIQYAQENSSYYSSSKYGLTSSGAMKYGLYGYENPAILNFVDDNDIYFLWNSNDKKFFDFNNWALFSNFSNFGFGLIRNYQSGSAWNDYKISAGFGSQSFSAGFGYGWSSGDLSLFPNSSYYTLGTIIRPNKFISTGLITNLPVNGESEGIFEAAIRPLGNELISVFGEYVYKKNYNINEAKWSVGAALEILPGVRFTGRYFENKNLNAGFNISFGNIGFTSQTLTNDNKINSTTYGIRIGGYDRNIFSKYFTSKENYVSMNLNGGIKYQNFQFFDNSNTLIGLLNQIEAAKNDKSISGIIINVSGIAANRSQLWELRNTLNDFKSSNKKVIIYFDRAGIDLYHFISVADKIIMDPIGFLTLEGYVTGRTYLKGTLEKLGIGATELRYFKYKSAYENFSRDSFSEGEKEQRQRLIDEFYKRAKKEITESRNISSVEFDRLVNEEVFILPQKAIEIGLADTLARWGDFNNYLNNLENKKQNFISAKSLEKFNLPTDNYWGEKPKVAVIYALGACAMDEGINARSLVNQVKNAVSDNNIKAIVLRVDSPGGDGLASDLIAEALKNAKGKKPIIVSQGAVAASGGYWLSMYADTIVAVPNTITGSIGVISGWFYNKGLKEELGMSTDFVKVGKHADMGFGFTLPLINISIPDRNYNEEELIKAEFIIKSFYKDFVDKVAEGRNMTYDEIDKIGEGRVWTGTDGKEIGLVDVLGGLNTAIEIAVEKSGLKGKEFEVIEMPKPGLINFGMFIPNILPFNIKSEEEQKDNFVEELKFRLKFNGSPLFMLPFEDYNLVNY